MKELSSHATPPRRTDVEAVYSQSPRQPHCRACRFPLSVTDRFCAACGVKKGLHPLAIVAIVFGGLLFLASFVGASLSPTTTPDSPPSTGIRSCDTFLKGAGNWNEDPRMDELPILNSYGERCLYEMNEDHLLR